MARKSAGASQPVFHAPMRIDWTDEKLQALSQEQLLNLLDNLDRQRTIGRVASAAAAAVDQRITALLTSRNSARRRKQVLHVGAGVSAEPQ
jgi:hypothetical protein